MVTSKPVSALTCSIYSLASRRYSQALLAGDSSYHWGRAVYRATEDLLKSNPVKFRKFKTTVVGSNIDCKNIPERVEEFVSAIDNL